MKKILVTGGNGRFATALKEINNKYLFNFRSKKQLNILSENSLERNILTLLLGFVLPLMIKEFLSLNSTISSDNPDSISLLFNISIPVLSLNFIILDSKLSFFSLKALS